MYTCGRRWSLHLQCRALFLDTAPCTGRIRCFLWLVFWIASALRCLLCGCLYILCVVAFLLSWFGGCCLLVAFCNFSCTCKIPCLFLIFLYYVYLYRSWCCLVILVWLYSPVRVSPDRAYKFIDLFILSWLSAVVVSAMYTCSRRWLL